MKEPRRAKDIDLKEEEFKAGCRTYIEQERSELVRNLAFAVESGNPDEYKKFKEKFVKTYGNFNEYEKAGLRKIMENILKQ